MKRILAITALLAGFEAHADAGRAAEGDDVVLRRKYPKTRTVEAEAGAGLLLNPTFVETAMARLSVRYHWSETWGLGIAVGAAQTKDRDERACVESFYNDPKHEAGAPCESIDGGASTASGNVNVGPAYVPVRQLRGLVTAFGDYTLAYGKQILLHGATSSFDLRVRFGGGVVASTLYDERLHVRGNESRPSRGDPETAGVSVGERDAAGLLYGVEGRPEPREEMSPTVYVALAQELHFFRRFFATGELASYVMATGAGIEPFFVAHLGLGVRL